MAFAWTETQCLFRLFPLVVSISFAMDVYVPAIPEMAHFFNTTNTSLQATLYVFMLTVAAGQLIAGPLADYYGRKRMAIASALLFFIGSLMASFAQHLSLLIIARVVQAMGACGTYLLCFIVIRDHFSTVACARLFSLLTGMNAVAASTAPILGGLLQDWTHDWHSGFYCLSALGVLMTVAAYRIPEDGNVRSSSACFFPQRIMAVITEPTFRQYTLIACSSLLGLYLFCALSPSILISQRQLSATQYGLWFGANAMTVFLANLLASRLTYHYPLERIVRSGLTLMIAACFAMSALSFYTQTVLRFMLPMLTLTAGIGLSMGSATALALKPFEQQASLATAVLSASQFALAGLIGILVSFKPGTPALIALPVLVCALQGIWGSMRLRLYPVDAH